MQNYKKQGQTVHMLQLFWLYIPLARLHIYYTHIQIYIHYTYIFTCSTLKFSGNIFIEDAMPEKASKYALFKKDQNPLNIFQKFLKK